MISYQYSRFVSLDRLINHYLLPDFRVNSYANVISYTTFATYDYDVYSPLIAYSDYLNTYDNDIYMFIPTYCSYGVYGSYILNGNAVHRDSLSTGYTKLIYTVHYDDGNIEFTEYSFSLADDIVFPTTVDPTPEPEPVPEPIPDKYVLYTIVYEYIGLPDWSKYIHYYSDGSTYKSIIGDGGVIYAYNFFLTNPFNLDLSDSYYVRIYTDCCILLCCKPDIYVDSF